MVPLQTVTRVLRLGGDADGGGCNFFAALSGVVIFGRGVIVCVSLHLTTSQFRAFCVSQNVAGITPGLFSHMQATRTQCVYDKYSIAVQTLWRRRQQLLRSRCFQHLL